MAKRMTKAARAKRRNRVLLIIIIILALLAAGVGMLRQQVTSQVNEGAEMPLSATVTRGSISTTVSGSGNLADEDVQALTFHSGVKIDETLVAAGDQVTEGELLATVDMTSVLSAMSEVQSEINDLDKEIKNASDEELADTIACALEGRVMKLYAAAGDDVSTVMYEHGALALISLDGYLSVELETVLTPGKEVTVTASDGTAYAGTVEGESTVLISDEKALYGDTVTVTDGEGNTLGSGVLEIHEPLKITGIAGTIKAVKYSENLAIKAGKTLFTLTDTSFSANYRSLLQEREELEEELMKLITIYQDGGVRAPISGSVSSIGGESTSSQSAYSSFGTQTSTAEEQTLLSICPGTAMTVSISVDETDILSLELGQAASVTVDALEDEVVSGTVTQIDTTATSSGGVTVYAVTVTFDKTEKMLSGMSADVSIVIQGVENALLIPSDALTQTRANYYVYTGYDPETGELGTMVEVTAGMNNGKYVEITSGLSEGDTVYYFEKEENSFGFSFGNMGGFGGGMTGGMTGGNGGEMPDFGGNMPGGNAGGGMPGGYGGRGQ